MSSFAGAHRCPARGAARVGRSGRLGGVVARLIDRFNAMVRGDGPGAPVGRLFGFRPTAIETGKATFELEAGPQHANPMGTLHGGIICDPADAAVGTAYASTLDEGESFTTLEPKINFLRPFWSGRLVAAARTVKTGRTSGLGGCAVADPDGRLAARPVGPCTAL